MKFHVPQDEAGAVSRIRECSGYHVLDVVLFEFEHDQWISYKFHVPLMVHISCGVNHDDHAHFMVEKTQK